MSQPMLRLKSSFTQLAEADRSLDSEDVDTWSSTVRMRTISTLKIAAPAQTSTASSTPALRITWATQVKRMITTTSRSIRGNILPPLCPLSTKSQSINLFTSQLTSSRRRSRRRLQAIRSNSVITGMPWALITAPVKSQRKRIASLRLILMHLLHPLPQLHLHHLPPTLTTMTRMMITIMVMRWITVMSITTKRMTISIMMRKTTSMIPRTLDSSKLVLSRCKSVLIFLSSRGIICRK